MTKHGMNDIKNIAKMETNIMKAVLECVIALFLALCLNFAFMRSTISCVISSLVNRSAEKKRNKAQNFLDWFFYRRYRDVLPKKFIRWYYSLFIAFFIAVIATVILQLLNLHRLIIAIPTWAYSDIFLIQLGIFWYTGDSKKRSKKRKRWYHK